MKILTAAVALLALTSTVSTTSEARWYAANAGPVFGYDAVGICAPLDEIDFDSQQFQTPAALMTLLAKRGARVVHVPGFPARVAVYRAGVPNGPVSELLFFGDQDECQAIASMLDKRDELKAERSR
jgi:hypothetical protein